MTGPAQRMLLLPAQCNAAEAHGLALARQRNISSPGISRELCSGAAAVIASGQHCGGLGLGGGPVVLSWWRSQLNCTAVRLVRRANPVFFFSLAGLWDSLGPWRYGTSQVGFSQQRSWGPPGPVMGVDLRCLWCGFAVHLFCCLVFRLASSGRPHPIDSLACLLLLVIVYRTGLYWFADMF
jgi:hypothetical protein